MALLFDSWFSEFCFITSALLFVYYIKYRFVASKHWRKLNIFNVEPIFIFGNTGKASFTDNFGFIIADLYKKWKHKKLVGFWRYTKPTLLVTDLDIIKNILTRDFNYFRDRRSAFHIKHDPLTGHLFNLNGSQWRKLRVKLTPTFTSGKMKMMFPTMIKCGEELQKYLHKTPEIREGIEVKDVLARFTTDVISSCAFGIEVDSLNNPKSEFREYGRRIFTETRKSFFKRLLLTLSPAVFNFFKLQFTGKDVSEFFINIVRETIEYRETNKIRRNDFMDLLIQLKNHGKLEDVDGVVSNDKHDGDARTNESMEFSIEEATAQVFVFFLAGFETSSTTLTFALYELALNFEIQEKLQKEIDESLAKTGGKMTYEGIMEMEYLDKVIHETLRKHSPGMFLFRENNVEYEVPELNVKIPAKTPVIISIFGIHRDPDLHPNPEKFDPERFSPEEKAKRHNFALLPFGEGPRNCIGSRFGLMQSKIGLVSIISKFSVLPSKETPIPLEYDKMGFVLSPKSGMYLKFIQRT